tara:strand:+ start:112 stop:603 length:492 start_codon:yes stop_codon:yes gene_type:complete
MIIECINCNKKFNVNSELIPDDGRTIQCGSCDHVWFFKKNDKTLESISTPIPENIEKNINWNKQQNKKNLSKIVNKNLSIDKKKIAIPSNKGSEIVKYQSNSNFTVGKFLSIILVLIITFVGVIIVIDTFKTPLYQFFPKLEYLLFSLFETLKDIELFIKDLI